MKQRREKTQRETNRRRKKKTPLQSLLIKVMVGVMGGKQSGIPPVKSIKHRYKIQVDALLMKTTVSQVSVCSAKGHDLKKNPLPLITRIERKCNQVVNRIREDLCCSVVYVLLQSLPRSKSKYWTTASSLSLLVSPLTVKRNGKSFNFMHAHLYLRNQQCGQLFLAA